VTKTSAVRTGSGKIQQGVKKGEAMEEKRRRGTASGKSYCEKESGRYLKKTNIGEALKAMIRTREHSSGYRVA